MVTVNRIGESITGSVKGKVFGVSYTPEKFEEMKNVADAANNATTVEGRDLFVEEFLKLTQEDFSTTVETACPNIHVNKATGQFFLKQDDKVSIHAMPKSFAERVLESVEKGINVTPMIKFWTRLLRNPHFTPKLAKLTCKYIAKTYTDYEYVEELMSQHGVSKDVAVERATTIQTPITMEGQLQTYKVSKEVFKKYALDEDGNKVQVDRYSVTKTIDEDTGEVTVDKGLPEYVEERVFQPAIMGEGGDAFYCGDKLGHQIKVGQVHYLPSWSQVSLDSNASCVPGLYAGNLDYVRGYQNPGTETHNVFIDPMHIGSFQHDAGAVRVKQYFVYDSFAGPTKSLYRSSEYGKLCDEQWVKERELAIEEANKVKAEVDKEVTELPE